MTFKRTLEIMKAKGFYPFEGRLDVFYEYGVTGDRELLQEVSLIRCSNGRYRVDYKRRDSGETKAATDARFHNPIAAATYANRVVIPALLAGKEST